MTSDVTPSSLAEALAAFQSELPPIGKANTANTGTYSYSYADLADISRAVMPLLGKHGLSFTSFPTLDEGGRFVLRYTLRHASGESDSGSYPLPANGSAQQMGSAISYARRYALSAVTGIAPDEDDDGKAAGTYEYRSERPASRQAPPATNGHAEDTVSAARAALAKKCQTMGYDRSRVEEKFREKYQQELGEATDPTRVRAFTKLLDGMPELDLNAATA